MGQLKQIKLKNIIQKEYPEKGYDTPKEARKSEIYKYLLNCFDKDYCWQISQFMIYDKLIFSENIFKWLNKGE